MPDQDPICLKDEENICWNLLKDMEKMSHRKGRLVPADSDLFEPLFVSNVCQLSGYLRW